MTSTDLYDLPPCGTVRAHENGCCDCDPEGCPECDAVGTHLTGCRLSPVSAGCPACDLLGPALGGCAKHAAAPAAEAVAWDRAETDPCERGTPGCSVRHTRDSDCETW